MILNILAFIGGWYLLSLAALCIACLLMRSVRSDVQDDMT